MKNLIAALAVFGFMTAAHAEETMSEKAEAKAHDAKRAVKKGAHRLQEKLCAKGDVACLKQKAENRASEAGEYTQDKAKEIKNNVDSDKK